MKHWSRLKFIAKAESLEVCIGHKCKDSKALFIGIWDGYDRLDGF
jgi:hypothetical protein